MTAASGKAMTLKSCRLTRIPVSQYTATAATVVGIGYKQVRRWVSRVLTHGNSRIKAPNWSTHLSRSSTAILTSKSLGWILDTA